MKKFSIMITLTALALFLVQCKSTFNSKEAYVLLKGTWAQYADENADFVISEKKIEYFDTGYLYDFKVTNDRVFTVLDSNKVVLNFRIIKLTQDSLVIQSRNEGNRDIIYKYYKRK